MTEALEIVGGLAKLQLQPGDVLVLSVPQRLSMEIADRLTAVLHERFGADQKVLVLDGGISLQVVRAAAAPGRSHRQIVIDAGGATAMAEITGAEPGTAKQWKRADSIPSRYWKALVDAGKATLIELADYAADPCEEAAGE